MSVITQVPFYPSDWLAGTRGMTAAQMGVYITLIAMMYERAAPIPGDDIAKLARLCGTSASSMRTILDELISDEKITLADGMLFNRRAELEIKNVMAKSEVARASAEARWQKNPKKSKDDESERNADAMLAISHKVLSSPTDQKELNARKPPKSGSCEGDLIALGVAPQTVSDWQAVRRSKRAGPITKTVIEGLVAESAKARISVADAVRIAAERGWQGFRAEWVAGLKPNATADPATGKQWAQTA